MKAFSKFSFFGITVFLLVQVGLILIASGGIIVAGVRHDLGSALIYGGLGVLAEAALLGFLAFAGSDT